MAKDVVIGCITDYSYSDIEPWVVSLERSGFTGTKAIIAYNIDKPVIDKLLEKNFTVFGFDKDNDGNFRYPKNKFSIVVERFIHMYYFLSQIEEPIRWVVATDVRDVVFQADPIAWLENHEQHGSLVVTSEDIKYKDEPWSKNNMEQAFGPFFYEMMKEQEIYCAGVIAGKLPYFLDLCLQTFLLCRGSPEFTPGGGGPDQSAMNIILNSNIWSNEVFKSNSARFDFCTHVGTTLPAIQAGFGDVGLLWKNSSMAERVEIEKTLLSGEKYQPHMLDDYVRHGIDGTPYAIVHQYNRVPEWKEKIEKKYRE